MVLLKRNECHNSMHDRERFTFQYGSIKTIADSGNRHEFETFTFQYGSIKTEMVNTLKKYAERFTFQYGSIKTTKVKIAICLIENLHSSMVLLKRKSGGYSYTKAHIYIPVWFY